MRASRSFNRGVDFSLLSQPSEITTVGPFLDLLQVSNCLGFVARLAGIIHGHDHLDLDGDDVFVALDQARPLRALPGNPHWLALIEKVDGHKLGDAALSEMQPDRLELSAIRQTLTNFDRRIRFGV